MTASGKLCDYEYFLIPVLFVKTKEMSLKKFAFWLRPIFTIFYRKYIVAFIARVDQEDIKFVFCIKNWFTLHSVTFCVSGTEKRLKVF